MLVKGWFDIADWLIPLNAPTRLLASDVALAGDDGCSYSAGTGTWRRIGLKIIPGSCDGDLSFSGEDFESLAVTDTESSYPPAKASMAQSVPLSSSTVKGDRYGLPRRLSLSFLPELPPTLLGGRLNRKTLPLTLPPAPVSITSVAKEHRLGAEIVSPTKSLPESPTLLAQKLRLDDFVCCGVLVCDCDGSCDGRCDGADSLRVGAVAAVEVEDDFGAGVGLIGRLCGLNCTTCDCSAAAHSSCVTRNY